MEPKIAGALVGWRYEQTQNGIVLKMQSADSLDMFRRKEFEVVAFALNERQLRSLARDLGRAARARGMTLHSPQSRSGKVASWVRQVLVGAS